ncbi:MAG: hypothetical protein KA746_15005 [Pyrinomonadaceae bacterium]|nr:hypothetical protein [Pyrinomonadaceae bacterium]MBP6213501.1 hypothetical protein [Pyrinomonadaceae bacterium]
MNYPIKLSFKLLAIASQIYVRDANGHLIGYVKQKLFKLKEDINVFADEQQTQHLYKIKADRIIDFSAKYTFTDAQGRGVGSISRKGMRSIFKAHYLIFDENENQIMEIREENGWVKVVDTVVGEVPILGMFTGYFFNPAYIVSRVDGTHVARLAKQPAFMEGIFELEPVVQIPAEEEAIVLLSVLTMTLLERSRG